MTSVLLRLLPACAAAGFLGVPATGAAALRSPALAPPTAAAARTAPPPGAPAAPESPETFAFVDVTVVPMDRERVLEGHTVVVRDGRIVAVGPAGTVDVPADAVRIEGRGRWLVPGLAEMHGHLPGPQWPAGLAERVLLLYAANGVTTVRGMLGHPDQLTLRDRIARGDLVGPRLFVGSPAMGGNGVTTPEQARRLVQEYAEAGYDHLKVHEGLSRPVFDAIAEAAGRAGLPFAGHVSDAVGVWNALGAGQSTIDHLDGMVEATEGGRRTAELVEAVKRAGAGVVPTQVLWETFSLARPPEELLAERPESRYLPAQMVRGWIEAQRELRAEVTDPAEGPALVEARRRLLGALSSGGARVLLGTDSPQLFSVPGFSIHREMRAMVEAGLTPWQVLAAGTRDVAVHLDLADESGTIAVGKRADLLLLEADPLADVGNVARRAGVMLNGRWLDAAELDRRLADVADAYAADRPEGEAGAR
jgi:imidazolonepropionase-like amidohydrolase